MPWLTRQLYKCSLVCEVPHLILDILITMGTYRPQKLKIYVIADAQSIDLVEKTVGLESSIQVKIRGNHFGYILSHSNHGVHAIRRPIKGPCRAA